MTEDIKAVVARVKALREQHRDRDLRAAEVRAVRHGNFDQVAPDLFSDEWPRSIVANRIDVTARHAAAALAPLPQFTAQSVTAQSDTAREFADRRTKIANHYVERSEVQLQMQRGADQFYTYGLLVTSIEPNLDETFPDIFVEEAVGFYPVWDRRGRTVEMAHVFSRSAVELQAEYPDEARRIETSMHLAFTGDRKIDVVKYVSDSRVVMYLEQAPDIVLADSPNPLGRCTYVATQKPGLDREVRGAFDDLIYVQLALHAMQTFTMQAAAQSVNAPIAAPNDVTEVNVGPNEIIRSSDPSNIRRVSLEVPMGAWQAGAELKQELEYGAITPEALGGSIDASVVTGKGVQQLMAGYSQQIAMAQESLVAHWRRVVELCFRMDEKFWPNKAKHIEGHKDGTPYKLTYTPSKHIKGDYTVEVKYGGVAGLDPNRALVFMLQAQGAGLVSNDYVRRHLPSDINPTEEEAKILVEQLRGSLVQGISAYVQSIPQLVANGQDPSDVISKAASAVKEAQKGKKFEDILSDLFPVPEPVDPASLPPEEQMAAAVAGDGSDGLTPAGMPPGLRPGLATEGPGGRPPMEMLFSGLTSTGQPNLQAGVSRMNPARTV